jgi:hypothetical protein
MSRGMEEVRAGKGEAESLLSEPKDSSVMVRASEAGELGGEGSLPCRGEPVSSSPSPTVSSIPGAEPGENEAGCRLLSRGEEAS